MPPLPPSVKHNTHMKITKITRVAVSRLRLNEGQLDWLPRNPRQWTQTDIDRMVRSMEEDPDFADVRPVLATPAEDGTLVVWAHNLLTKAAQTRGDKTLPVATYTPETEEDRETIRRLAIKDNGSFGSWDTDALANDWNAEPWQLEEWGVPEWITGGAGKETGSGETGSGETSGEQKAKKPTMQALITFPDADALADFAAKVAPGIIEQYDAEIIY